MAYSKYISKLSIAAAAVVCDSYYLQQNFVKASLLANKSPRPESGSETPNRCDTADLNEPQNKTDFVSESEKQNSNNNNSNIVIGPGTNTVPPNHSTAIISSASKSTLNGPLAHSPNLVFLTQNKFLRGDPKTYAAILATSKNNDVTNLFIENADKMQKTMNHMKEAKKVWDIMIIDGPGNLFYDSLKETWFDLRTGILRNYEEIDRYVLSESGLGKGEVDDRFVTLHESIIIEPLKYIFTTLKNDDVCDVLIKTVKNFTRKNALDYLLLSKESLEKVLILHQINLLIDDQNPEMSITELRENDLVKRFDQLILAEQHTFKSPSKFRTLVNERTRTMEQVFAKIENNLGRFSSLFDIKDDITDISKGKFSLTRVSLMWLLNMTCTLKTLSRNDIIENFAGGPGPKFKATSDIKNLNSTLRIRIIKWINHVNRIFEITLTYVNLIVETESTGSSVSNPNRIDSITNTDNDLHQYYYTETHNFIEDMKKTQVKFEMIKRELQEQDSE